MFSRGATGALGTARRNSLSDTLCRSTPPINLLVPHRVTGVIWKSVHADAQICTGSAASSERARVPNSRLRDGNTRGCGRIRHNYLIYIKIESDQRVVWQEIFIDFQPKSTVKC